MLRRETANAIGGWILKNLLCRRGTLVEIVTDNGTRVPFVKSLGHPEEKYHVKHIRISGYNLRTNGIVECSHFDGRKALFKAADGDQKRQSLST